MLLLAIPQVTSIASILLDMHSPPPPPQFFRMGCPVVHKPLRHYAVPANSPPSSPCGQPSKASAIGLGESICTGLLHLQLVKGAQLVEGAHARQGLTAIEPADAEELALGKVLGLPNEVARCRTNPNSGHPCAPAAGRSSGTAKSLSNGTGRSLRNEGN